jgi:hypothetical protein
MVRSGVTVYSTPGGRHLRWMTSSMGAPTGRAGENPSAGPKGTRHSEKIQDYFAYQCAETDNRGPAGSNPPNNTSAH